MMLKSLENNFHIRLICTRSRMTGDRKGESKVDVSKSHKVNPVKGQVQSGVILYIVQGPYSPI